MQMEGGRACRQEHGGESGSNRTARLERAEIESVALYTFKSARVPSAQRGPTPDRHILVWERRGNDVVFSDPQYGFYDDHELVTTDEYSDAEVMIVRLDQANPTDAILDVIDPTMTSRQE